MNLVYGRNVISLLKFKGYKLSYFICFLFIQMLHLPHCVEDCTFDFMLLKVFFNAVAFNYRLNHSYRFSSTEAFLYSVTSFFSSPIAFLALALAALELPVCSCS